MKIKQLTRLIAIAIMLCVCSCSGARTEDEIKNDDNRIVPVSSGLHKTVIMDKETGVEYLLYAGGYSAAITPLYNADGTLKVNKYFKEEEK